MRTLLLSCIVFYIAFPSIFAQEKEVKKNRTIVLKEESKSNNASSSIIKTITTENDNVIIKTIVDSDGEIKEEIQVINVSGQEKNKTVDSLIKTIMVNGGNFNIEILNGGDAKIVVQDWDNDIEVDTDLSFLNDTDGLNNWIDINDIEEIIQIKKMNESRPFMGVILDDGALESGITILNVIENGAAHKAGIEKNDIITAINKHNTSNIRDIGYILQDKKVGDTVDISLERNGEAKTFELVLARQADNQYNIAKSLNINMPTCCENKVENCEHHNRTYKAFKCTAKPELGIYGKNLTPEEASALAIEAGSGVLISKVMTESTASEMGLQVGDVIVQVDDKPIHTNECLQKYLNHQALGNEITVQYYRNGKLKKQEGILFKYASAAVQFNENAE